MGIQELEKKYIIAIINSPSGLGHVTRQLALVTQLLKIIPNIKIKFVCTMEQYKMISNQITDQDSIEFNEIPLTPSIAFDQWDKLHKGTTLYSFQTGWDFEIQIRDDFKWGKILYGCDLVVNDIECVHNPLVKKMQIPLINISNFTWSDILADLGSEELSKNYASLEQLADINLRLPFSTDCLGFSKITHNVGILSREIDWEIVKEIQGLSKNPLVIFTYSGKTWNSSLREICVYLIENNLTPLLPKRFAKEIQDLEILTFADDETNTQNYIAAARIAVGKIGYGTTSEIVTGGTYFVHWLVEDFIESSALSQYVVSEGYGEQIDTKITPTKLIKIIKKALNKRLEKKDCSTTVIAHMVFELLSNFDKIEE
ncbi:MAG: hypothetical protein ACXAD7_00605 [Candidatus Kariarchaeaceae archaeon]|jgi:hypothetical protein